MNVTRVSTASVAANQLNNIELAASNWASLQNKLSSGKQLTSASDDPMGSVEALSLQSQLSRNSQYASAGTDAMSRLSAADSAYQQSVNVVQKAQTLVTQALSTGTNDSSSYNAIASQIDGLRSTLLGLANTSFEGQPIFGGATTGTTAFDSSGNYTGTSQTVSRSVSSNASVDVTRVGTDVFGDDTSGIFAQLSSISDTLRTNPTSLSQSTLTSLNSSLGKLTNAEAAEGASYNQVQQLTTVGSASATALKSRLSSIQDADIAQLAVQTSAAQVAYNAALQTTATVGKLSLLNFLQ